MSEKTKISALLLLISVVLIIVSLYFVFSSMDESPLQSVEYDVEFKVSDSISTGFDVNGTALVFGRTSPGGTQIIRSVSIDNDYSFPIRVDTFVSEHISSALYFNSSYYVEQDQNLTIDIRLKVPKDFELGNYIGKIRFDLYEANSKK